MQRFFGVILLMLACASSHAAEIEGRELRLAAKEREVKTLYFRAAGDAPRPAALILHGAGGLDRRIDRYKRYAGAIAAAGIDAYLVYYYSSRDAEAGGGLFEQRYSAWARLIGDVANDVLAGKSSNGRIGLIGFSNGGILAPGAAALEPKINAAVVYYGAEPWPLPTAVTRFPPLLILHGDADAVIPVEAGQDLAAQARNLGSAVDLVIYPGEVHGFGFDFEAANSADALARTIAFLKKELLAP